MTDQLLPKRTPPMPLRDKTWPAGSPCWAELAISAEHHGIPHVRDFYERLFGWRTEESPEHGGYVSCFKDERLAAGITPTLGEGERPGWVTYFATEDVDASVEAVRDAGGVVHMDPSNASDLGRLASCADPTGATFGLWQPGSHRGFGIVAEPDTVVWHSLLTRDLAVTTEFYARVFGYRYQDGANGVRIATLADGAQVAGLHEAPDLADGVPSHWLLHFAVTDRDSSAQIGQGLGADVLVTSDSPLGPEALLRGPHGEVFTLLQSGD